ncbi:MAG: TldD/PmbA family protein [Thermoprotei archaeon]|nr:MAG: TldD/PmbA family protein [Thermoprotei archaeon]RLF03434.1 MAG: TldD/PmbA family protein [Thermoprotei archaeon]
MPYEDVLLYAIGIAERLGAAYAEARYHRISTFSISAQNGELLEVGRGLSEGVGIRVLVNGALGFASTNELSRESIREAVETAFKLAKVHAGLMKKPIEFSEANTGRVKYSVLRKKPFDAMSLEDKIKLHAESWNRAKEAAKEAKVSVLFSFVNESLEEKIVVNTDGAFVASSIPRMGFGYNFVVSHPQKGTIQRYFSYRACGGLEWLDVWQPVSAVASEVETCERVLIEGKKPPTDVVDVVLGSEVVGLIVHESCGHPSEADRILGREAAQAGKSFIKPEMLGERIGSEYATVIDDPTMPGSNGFYLYDDEGVPARPRYLYKEGVINEFLHNRWTARVFGVESNASARSMDYRSEPIIRMANTYFKPGDYTFEELIEDIKLGVYIKSYMEWNIDDERWSQRYVGLEAYLIENGELTSLVRNPVFEVTTKAFYSKVDGADKDLKFYAGVCGKGEPAQGVPVWFGGPNVRLRGIKLGVVPGEK